MKVWSLVKGVLLLGGAKVGCARREFAVMAIFKEAL